MTLASSAGIDLMYQGAAEMLSSPRVRQKSGRGPDDGLKPNYPVTPQVVHRLWQTSVRVQHLLPCTSTDEHPRLADD